MKVLQQSLLVRYRVRKTGKSARMWKTIRNWGAKTLSRPWNLLRMLKKQKNFAVMQFSLSQIGEFFHVLLQLSSSFSSG